MDAYGAITPWPSGSSDDLQDCGEAELREKTASLEQFLRARGVALPAAPLNLLNATPREATSTLDLLYQLASFLDHDVRAREQLRDQADKDRVALGAARKRNEALAEDVRRLKAEVTEAQAKLLAERHRREEGERDLKSKLASTTTRLNGFLNGNKGAASAGAAAARRGTLPAYDRYADDPAETVQALEAQVSQLKADNARLQRQVAAARPAAAQGVGSSGASRTGARRERVSPAVSDVRERRASGDSEGPEQTRSSSGGGAGARDTDLQAGRRGLTIDVRPAPDAGGARAPDVEVSRLRRQLHDMQLSVEALTRSKLDLHAALDKGAADRAELTRTLHSLRSKCASLEVERRNAEDRFHRAQRAAVAAMEPAAAEAAAAEARAQLADANRALAEAEARAADLQRRLAGAEATVEASERHIEMLKRALRMLPGKKAEVEALHGMVAEELLPLQERLRVACEEVEEARAAQRAAAAARPATADAAAPRSAGFGFGHVPLSPLEPTPPSPAGLFDGFTPGPLPSSGSPPLLLQAPPAEAFGGRALMHSATMPSPHSRAHSRCGDLRADSPQQQALAALPTAGGAPPSPSASFAELAVSEEVTAHVTTANAPAWWRRSLSAGPQRPGVGVSAERRRWELPNPHKRYPSPLQVLMQQASHRQATQEHNITLAASPPPPRGPLAAACGVVCEGSAPLPVHVEEQ